MVTILAGDAARLASHWREQHTIQLHHYGAPPPIVEVPRPVSPTMATITFHKLQILLHGKHVGEALHRTIHDENDDIIYQ